MRIPAAVVLLLLLATPCFAEPAPPYLYLAPFAGRMTMDEDFRTLGSPLDDGNYFGGRLGLRLGGLLALELAGGTVPTRHDVAPGQNADVDFVHGSADLLFHPLGARGFSPFVFLGAGPASTKPSTGDEKVTQLRASYGVGAHLWFADHFGLRLEGRGLAWIPKENWDKTDVNDLLVGAGLVFALGGTPPDVDGDGVSDRNDRCPATPRGVIVDTRGCPVDSDHDGVFDGPDQCAGTPAGARVDARGCPLDSDGDGVSDGIDVCEGTLAGARVDPRGCPLDADGDGVPDGIDRCADTPRGIAVDDSGCVRDSDGDGVRDDRDRCPETPRGAVIDSAGCPAAEAEIERGLTETGRIRLESVRFESGLAVLMMESFEVLDQVGRVLLRHPEIHVEVAGHTDSRGDAAANRTLSLKRATAVRDYLLEKYPQIGATRMTVRGYGEDRPVASNATDDGRAQNRRVEFVVRSGPKPAPERLPAQPGGGDR